MSAAGLIGWHAHTESVVSQNHRAVNHFLRNLFWYIVVGVAAIIALRRFVSFLERNWDSSPAWLRKGSAALQQPPIQCVLRIHAFARTAFRCISYRRLVWTSGWGRYLSPPSAGEAVFLCGYWAILLLMLWTRVIFKSGSPLYGIEWEVVGYRAAWVSTTQLPLVYCTGSRINPISLLTGISHERLNWFHRWAARTVFMTLIVHWAFFYREWDLANFVQQEIELMPMVIWGFAAWAMFGFMVITGFGFFRECIYEIWLLVHILSAYLGLLLTYTHTHCTTYFVLASLGFIAFDICGRIVLWTTHNVLFFPERHPPKTLGYNAKLQILNNDYVYLSIADVAFRWKAGQHVYITIPHLRKIESHPFTIANLAGNSGPRREMALIIKPRHGFSLDLLRWGLKHSSKSLTVFLNGPYENPPSLAGYDTVVMIATGNRASFTVPLLQELVCTGLKVPRVSVHMICRTSSDMGWYLSQLQATLKSIPLYSTELEIQVHITSSTDSDATDIPLDQAQAPYSGAPGTQTHWTDMFNYEKEEIELEPDSHHVYSGERSDKNSRDSSGSISPYPNDAKARDDEEEEEEQLLTEPSATDPTSAELPAQSSVPRTMVLSQGRPSVDAMIRPAVTDARGRVLVVAAVAGRLRSQISTCVSRLNRELVMPGLIGRDGSDTFPLSLELWCEVNGD